MNTAVLEELMRSTGITTSKLEKELSLGNGTIRKWRVAPTNPKIDTLQKVANYFGVDVGYLL